MNSNLLLNWITKLLTNGSLRDRRSFPRGVKRGASPWRPEVEVLEDRVTPSVFTVTDLTDGAGSATDVTLRYAVNTAQNGDTINFSVPNGNTITLSSPLTIGTNVAISGPGATNLAVSGGDAVQVFNVGSGVTAASITGLTIEHGNVTGSGGGIYNTGILTLSNDALSNNAAVSNSDGTIPGNGGAIANGGTLTLSNDTLTSNTAGSSGGGVENYGTLMVSDSTFTSNTALFGGGLTNDGAATIATSTFAGNAAAGSGGGIDIYYGTTTLISDSTIAFNTAPSGAGIDQLIGALTLTNDTIAYNDAAVAGGGLANPLGTVTMQNTIVAGNTDASGTPDVDGTLLAANYCLIGNSAGLTIGGGGNNVLDVSPGLDSSLADNGGTTQTLALLSGSPALGAGDPSQAGTTAQNNVIRPAAPDIGAYQSVSNVTAPTVTGLSPNSGPEAGGTTVIITGTGFTGATAVDFGATAALGFTINSDTQITATAPPGAAGPAVDVTVVNGGTSATSPADQFTYVAVTAPTVSSVVVNGDPGNDLSSANSALGDGNSRVDTLYVTFNEAVQLDFGAFAMSLHNNVTINGVTGQQVGTVPAALSMTSTDNIHWTITFVDSTFNTVNQNSDAAEGYLSTLLDGVYDLTVTASAVHPLGVTATNMAANNTTTFWALFGDTGDSDTISSGPSGAGSGTAAGDGNTHVAVGGGDFGLFANAYEAGATDYNFSTGYDPTLDFGGGGSDGALAFGAFGNNYGVLWTF